MFQSIGCSSCKWPRETSADVSMTSVTGKIILWQRKWKGSFMLLHSLDFPDVCLGLVQFVRTGNTSHFHPVSSFPLTRMLFTMVFWDLMHCIHQPSLIVLLWINRSLIFSSHVALAEEQFPAQYNYATSATGIDAWGRLDFEFGYSWI